MFARILPAANENRGETAPPRAAAVPARPAGAAVVQTSEAPQDTLRKRPSFLAALLRALSTWHG